MKRKLFFISALALIVAGGIFWACQKEEIAMNSEDGLKLKGASSTDCETCVDNWIDSKATYVLRQSTDETKYCKLDVYNKFDTLFFSLYGSATLATKSYNVTIDGVRYPTNGNIDILGSTAQWWIIKSPWQSCTEVIINQITVNGLNDANFGPVVSPGPPFYYYMQELCTTTTLEASLANPVCTGETVTLTAEVTASEDVTAGTLKIIDVTDPENALASVSVSASVFSVTYDYTPTVAGSVTFKAVYEGDGGFADSESDPVEVVSEVCGECETWQTESAFGGDEGVNVSEPRQWWYYFVSEDAPAKIWAGLTIEVGTVDIVDGDLVLTLTGGWELRDVAEAVKVYGFTGVPSSAPNPGQNPDDLLYKGDQTTIEDIAVYPYYVIHLDVRKCIDSD